MSEQLRTSMLFTAEGQAVLLDGIYRGRTAFLLCGGPSLVRHDLQKLQQRGVLTCAVNNAAAVFRPHLWVAVDPPSHFCDAIWRDPSILKFVPVNHLRKRLVVRDEQDVLRPSKELARDMPAVFGFRLNKEFVAGRWLYEETFNWGNDPKRTDADGNTGSRSVMYVALRLLFHLGIRRLYLLGCDFRMQVDKANYAFPQRRTATSVRTNNETYRILNARLARLLPYFEKEGYEIFNSTPDSGLTVFPYVPYENAVTAACSTMPKRILTEGMYGRLGRRARQRRSSAPALGRPPEKASLRPAVPLLPEEFPKLPLRMDTESIQMASSLPETGSNVRERAIDSVIKKAWGTARLLYLDDRLELAQLIIHRGGYSSRHQHRFKTNGFLVAHGRLLVISYAGDEQTRRVLSPFEGICLIPPEADHRFFAIEDETAVYELYYAVAGRAISQADILRRDRNGLFAGNADEYPG